jgi:hypothetical protein
MNRPSISVSTCISVVLATTFLVGRPVLAYSPAEVCTIDKFPNLKHLSSQRRVEVLGGGEVQQGPFTFCLFLYTDPEPVVLHPGRIEEIPDAYWAAFWRYDGSGTEARVSYRPMLSAPDVRQLAYHLHQGDSGGQFAGGVRLPRNSHMNEQAKVGIRVDSIAAAYGAQLTFTLNRKRIDNISVSPEVPGGPKPNRLSEPKIVPRRTR